MLSKRPKTLEQRLSAPGPKRILAIDGGGLRGIVSAGILAELERQLRRRSMLPDLRLCDYFDLIGGSSTGAILAAGLAFGKSCAEMADVFRAIAPDSQAQDNAANGILRPRFDVRRLEDALIRLFGDNELQSPQLQTGLAVFLKRIDTGAAWAVTNNPNNPFFEGGGATGPIANRHLLIRKLVQACAGAPVFFAESAQTLSRDGLHQHQREGDGFFVDGALAGLHNPALQTLKVATQQSFGFGWQASAERLMLVSVGSGYWRPSVDSIALAKLPFGDWAPTAARAVLALQTMTHDTSLQVIETLQSMSEPAKPWRINSEVGEMKGDLLAGYPLLHFQRMDVRMEPNELYKLGLEYAPADIEAMKQLAGVDAVMLERLHTMGLKAGEDYFRSAPSQPVKKWDELILPTGFDPQIVREGPMQKPQNRLAAIGMMFNGKGDE
jgi:hypothetical protein